MRNPLLDDEADKWKQFGNKIDDALDSAGLSTKEPKKIEWELHSDDEGSYHSRSDLIDKYGRPIKYREKNPRPSNRKDRRAIGIRTPIALLEAYEEMLAEEALGTRDDRVGLSD